MSIQDKITRLQTAKDNIAEAITAKGGTVNEGDGFEEFSSDIGTISSGITVNESYDISEGTLNSATVTLEGDVTAHIPDGVVTVGKTAFKNNVTITKVIMPDSVETIENGGYYGYDSDGAFYECLSLKNVELSNNLTNIGDYAFYECTNITSITIPDGVTSIGDYAFYNCSKLALTTLPDSVTSIGSSAFNGCEGLTSITIPDSVTSIGSYAFQNCISLTSITIPDSVTNIGEAAFQNCTSLTSITIPDSITSIGNDAFGGCTSLIDIYYTGTQAEWEAITGISNAGIPAGATIHYNYTPAE